MSAIIKPDHSWLYGKISLVSQREDYIYKKAYELCGGIAEELREQVWQTYGVPLLDADLNELFGQGDIDKWLLSQINSTEVREAAYIKELLRVFGDAANDLIEQAFSEHGKMTGEKAKSLGKYDVSTAQGIYSAINDYVLNGMQRCQDNVILYYAESSLLWDTGACAQEQNWKRAGIDRSLMTVFYQAWVKAFVEALNPTFEYRYRSFHQLAGATGVRHEIVKK